tara:strand:+ start:17611 stop:18252 length:642 start_codon:yes stop_codon:yes gene_type:complete
MITKIGKHKVQHGDIMSGIDNLMENEMADLIYSDPPWGQGNLKYWQTINKRHTGTEPTDIKYEKFLPTLFGIFRKFAKDVVVIEYGEKWRDDIISYVDSYGFIHGGVCTSLYGNSKKLLPLDVHVFSKSGIFKIDDEFKTGCLKYRGGDLSIFIFEKILSKEIKGTGIVLDPMCGMGYTAQSAIKHNLAFRGNELNSKRLDKTIHRLRKNTSK